MMNFEIDDSAFEFITKLVHEKFGIVLGAHKKSMVYRRLAKRLDELEMNDFGQYTEFLKANENELPFLANAITTNLTSFFRENHHFEHLTETLTEHFKTKRSLRIWSAGCSMGCEPYTIALIVANVLGGKLATTDVKILATDVDTNVLKIGMDNKYDSEDLKKIPAQYMQYIENGGEQFSFKPEVAKIIYFKKLNLLEDWPISKSFDIIFCRNVVIYFDKPTQRVLFEKFANVLNDDGYIYIGHSENLLSVSERFRSIGKTIYTKV